MDRQSGYRGHYSQAICRGNSAGTRHPGIEENWALIALAVAPHCSDLRPEVYHQFAEKGERAFKLYERVL